VGIQPTPLFERLVTEEVQELKTYAGIVERQNQELHKQKKVQEDLEVRLRSETRRRKELESILEEQERLWNEKYVDLERQRDAAEKRFKAEESKTKKLIDQVQRKDRDIQGFIKKKVRLCALKKKCIYTVLLLTLSLLTHFFLITTVRQRRWTQYSI
jgi:paraquat-inducible protein B